MSYLYKKQTTQKLILELLEYDNSQIIKDLIKIMYIYFPTQNWVGFFLYLL